MAGIILTLAEGVFTSHQQGRRFKRIYWPQAMPPCQGNLLMNDARPCPKPGEYDSPLQGRTQWADLCEDHVCTLGRRDTRIGFHRVRENAS